MLISSFIANGCLPERTGRLADVKSKGGLEQAGDEMQCRLVPDLITCTDELTYSISFRRTESGYHTRRR